MERNNLFPVFLKLEELNTLLVGGGNVGLEKLAAILKNSPQANVTVVAGLICEPIKELTNSHPNVKLIERNFINEDLSDVDIVILATDDKQLHIQIREMVRAKRLLVNVADTPDLCDFYLGAVVTKGNLKIGISTNGKSPTIAKRMREYLEEALPDDTNTLLENMRSIRDKMKGDFSEKVKTLNEITSSWLNKNKEKE
jgi:siroheme synthase-like protein